MDTAGRAHLLVSVSLFGLLALISLTVVLAYRYRVGRQHPRVPEGGSGSDGVLPEDSPTVCVYGEECPAVRTAGSAIYVTGGGVVLMEDDTIRLDGRSFTVTELRRTAGGRGEGVLIVGLSELP